MLQEFSTTRLLAERLQEKHFEVLCRMHQNPSVMATLGGLRSAEQTREFLNSNLDHWRQHGYGLWVFAAKADGQFVGRGGLRHVPVAGSEELELAYTLEAAFWGQGLATEMAQAILDIGSKSLSRSSIVCFTLTSNRASQRVMEKLGFQYERDFVHGDQPHVLYRLDTAKPGTE